MPKISAAEINSIRLKEQGSNPSTPASGYGQLYIKSDGVYFIDDSGNVIGPIGGSESYVMVSDRKAQSTQSGTFTQEGWRGRTLNTEDSDADNICTLSSNQITLTAGTYRCRIMAPAWSVGRHMARLYNATDASTILTGTSVYCGGGASNHSIIVGRFTIGTGKLLEVQHYCETTYADQGFGVETGIDTETYTVAEFWKEA